MTNLGDDYTLYFVLAFVNARPGKGVGYLWQWKLTKNWPPITMQLLV